MESQAAALNKKAEDLNKQAAALSEKARAEKAQEIQTQALDLDAKSGALRPASEHRAAGSHGPDAGHPGHGLRQLRQAERL